MEVLPVDKSTLPSLLQSRKIKNLATLAAPQSNIHQILHVVPIIKASFYAFL
jgi:hypothetical protein